MRLKVCLWLIALFPFTVPAYAQFETASVVGTVRDTSGAACPTPRSR